MPASRTRRLWGLVILVGLLALPASAYAAPAPAEDLLRQAQALERRGELGAALRILRPAGANTEAGKHRVLLGEAIAAISASAVYSGLEDYERAEAVLQAVLKKLDAGRDLQVARALHRRVAAVGRRNRARADAEAQALLTKAAVLEREDEHDQAAATYKLVAERPAGEVSQTLVQRAKLGRIRAETAALEAEHRWYKRFWNWVKGPLETVAEWALYAALILALIPLFAGGRWLFRRLWPPADRTALALEDLTAETSERNAKNRVLTRELMTSIKSLGVPGGDSSSAEVDDTPDLDGTLLVNLKVVGSSLEAFESTIHDETPLKLGFVSFSPRQLLSLGAFYFRRRSKYELNGTLAAAGTRALFSVDLAEAKVKEPRRWAVTADGEGSRSRALGDMATRIVLDLGGSQVSTSWQSFREYRSAMNALAEAADPAKREASLQASRLAFQRSLDHDPANLLARFNLSNVLRKLGDNEAAVEHYAFLERLVAASDPERNAAAGLLLEKHADFPYIVRYNRACALAKIDDWECHQQAIQLLEELIHETDALPNDVDRRRLQLLVRATLASTLVFQVEQARHDQDSNRRNAIVRRIEEARDYVEELPAFEVPEWTTYVTARATVQNALGRTYYLVGRFDQANEAFERALSMMADFGDAHVNLASLLIDQKGRYSRWTTRAEDHLKRALELSPHDRKARYLLGLLYKEPAVNRLEEAKQQFAEVNDSRSLSQLAQINEREGDLAAAIATMRRSIYRSPEPDYRTELYLKWLLRLHQQTPQSREALEDGSALGERLVKATPERKRATALRDRVKQALAELGG